MTKNDVLLEQWKLASELHRHEDNLSWQKMNYFVAINGALFAIVGVSGLTRPETLGVGGGLLAVFGIVVSVVWCLTQGRGAYYQHYRIQQARVAEERLLVNNERVLDLYERGLGDQELVRVPRLCRVPTQRLMVVLGVAVAVLWLFILAYSFAG